MAVVIPEVKDLVTRNIALFESKLSQAVPPADRAFIRVLSVGLAMIEAELDRKGAYDAKQNLAISAAREGLINLGNEYEIAPEPAVAAVLTGTINADAGKSIDQTASFIGDSNGARYFPTGTFSEAGGIITVQVQADAVGVSGNLEVGQTLTISSQLAGIESTLTVTVINTTGADAESTDSFRAEVLDFVRTLKGGSNSSDYRRWSKEVAGVVNAFPYSKLPYDDASYPGVPPERTVYILVDTSIDADGIAPAGILTSVRTSITTDPITGLHRQALGLTDATLYIKSIRRTTLYIEIISLTVDPAIEASVKSDIDSAIETYLFNLAPFVVGLDFDGDKNDVITDLTLSDIVQDILSPVGGSAEGVNFGTAPGVFTVDSYELGEGETVKSGGVTYN